MNVSGKVLISLLIALVVICLSVGFWLINKLQNSEFNVILLTVDSINNSHLSYNGYHRKTTPILDQIVEKSIVFKYAYSSSSWTSPGLISIFTALYPPVHGVEARGRSLSSETLTIFDIFKNKGYKVPNISYLTQIPNFYNLGLEKEQPDLIKKSSYHGEDLIQWLELNHRSKFMVWFHYSALHLPYKPKEEFHLFLSDREKKTLKNTNILSVQKNGVIPINSLSFSPVEKETVISLYDGQLRELDSFVSKLLKKIRELDIERKTLLVITADHGEELFEHGFIGHASTTHAATLFDEVINIPLIFYAPSIFPSGKIIENQIRQIDIMPTVLDILDMGIPDGLHGVSALNHIEKRKPQNHKAAFSEAILAGYQSTPEQEKIRIRSIRQNGWKLICGKDDKEYPCYLFDLRKDTKEFQNMISLETSKAEEMKSLLNKHLEEFNVERLAVLSKQKVKFTLKDIPNEKKFSIPQLLIPQNGLIRVGKKCEEIELSWTGDPELTYVIHYDAGKGFKNLKGKMMVRGTSKDFGRLPSHICELLPEWNPYKIRVSPYGLDDYWSGWSSFNIVILPSGRVSLPGNSSNIGHGE